MIPAVMVAVLVAGGLILFLGLFKFLYLPLSLWFELAAAVRRRRGTPGLFAEPPLVSVVIPGFNEEAVIQNCVASVLESEYPRFEVILVDDGSTDRTAELMAGFAAADPRVRFVGQSNAGKGAALNNGMGYASGEVLMFVDADGVFAPNTVEQMVAGFINERVGAVCGDDRPVNLNKVLTRLLAVISHVGTGLVRRSLTVLRCLPIVSGNVGAFRRDVLEQTGPFNTATVGEDLELTWRVQRAGYQVRFAPRAIVYAESPSTLHGLWKQRVRWARGLLQTTVIHRRMIGNPRYGVFGMFLAYNTLTMVIVPVVQLLLVIALFPLVLHGLTSLPRDWVGFLGWLGLIFALALLLYSLILNRALGDLRHAWTLPLWPIYALFIGGTMAWALWLQARGAPARWNKLERSGVVSRRGGRRQPRHRASAPGLLLRSR